MAFHLRPFWRFASVALVGLALSACIYIPEPEVPASLPPSTPTPVASVPSAPRVGGAGSIDLGAWERADVQAVQGRFSRSVADSVGQNQPLGDALSTLQANAFACSAVAGRASPDRPVQVCERSTERTGCIHTWQVLIYGNARAGVAERASGIYDRVCSDRNGGGGLLGAPPG